MTCIREGPYSFESTQTLSGCALAWRERTQSVEDGASGIKSRRPVFPLTIPSGKPNGRLIVPVAPSPHYDLHQLSGLMRVIDGVCRLRYSQSQSSKIQFKEPTDHDDGKKGRG